MKIQIGIKVLNKLNPQNYKARLTVFISCLFQLVAEGYVWVEERKRFKRRGFGFLFCLWWFFVGFFSHQPLGLLDSNYE